MNSRFMLDNIDVAWCPGCGNYHIREALAAALEELGLSPRQTVIVSGIGQAAKMPQYLNVHYFNGLHGRAVPVATGVKAANPELTVIAEGGDGDMYGEGGNHFIHAIRRNPDITHVVHNNMVYGLTKGQASPTSQRGFVTPVQVNGVSLEPFNPVAVAVALGASFVARAFSGDRERVKDLLKQAIQHHGYALVDIFHPCVSFNKLNTFKWYKEHSYYLEGHDPKDREAAMRKAFETGKYPLGVIYNNPEDRKTFAEELPAHQTDKSPLWRRKVDLDKVMALFGAQGG